MRMSDSVITGNTMNSGRVPPPDSHPSLMQAGFNNSLWPYPHTYPSALNCGPTSPFKDVCVRQAANDAIDRGGLVKLLNGSAKPVVGLYPPEHLVFGTAKNKYGSRRRRCSPKLVTARASRAR